MPISAPSLIYFDETFANEPSKGNKGNKGYISHKRFPNFSSLFRTTSSGMGLRFPCVSMTPFGSPKCVKWAWNFCLCAIDQDKLFLIRNGPFLDRSPFWELEMAKWAWNLCTAASAAKSLKQEDLLQVLLRDPAGTASKLFEDD